MIKKAFAEFYNLYFFLIWLTNRSVLAFYVYVSETENAIRILYGNKGNVFTSLKCFIVWLLSSIIFTETVRLWPRGVPTPSTDIGLLPLLAAISPLSTDLRAGWTNNVGTVDLLQVMWRNG